jgi:hypothetical protein
MENKQEFSYHQKKVLSIIKFFVNREGCQSAPFYQKDITEVATFSNAVVSEVFFYLEKKEIIKLVGFNCSYPGDQSWQLTARGIDIISAI